MNGNIRKVFRCATETTFLKVLMVRLDAIEASTVTNENTFDVSGVIGFIGSIVGNMALSLREETAMAAISRLTENRISVLDDAKGGIGEIVNMIARNACLELGGLEIRQTIPEIIKGEGHELDFTRYSECFGLWFASEIGTVHLKVAYSSEFSVK